MKIEEVEGIGPTEAEQALPKLPGSRPPRRCSGCAPGRRGSPGDRAGDLGLALGGVILKLGQRRRP